eukprot:3844830-Rhodomonas_salina.1
MQAITEAHHDIMEHASNQINIMDLTQHVSAQQEKQTPMLLTRRVDVVARVQVHAVPGGAGDLCKQEGRQRRGGQAPRPRQRR